MIPYLVLADLQNNVLAAIFTFSDRVIYPAYATVARTRDGSALEDQAIAGVIMWVPGSVLFLVPVLWLVVTALMPPGPSSARHQERSADMRETDPANAALPSRD
jgi:cytochrome c oxidase assembly factor CtaG